MLGSTTLGYYNLAYQLTMALSTILNSLIGALGMPVFAQLTDEQEQENALFKVVEQIAFLTAPIYALFFLLVDKQAIALLFGPKWIPISTVIPWLLVFAYFRVINTPLNTMLCAKGRPEVNARVNLYIAPVAVVGFIIGAQQGGILGVSIAVALVLGIVWTFFWWWVGCRTLGWSMMKFLLPCFISVLITLPAIAISFNLPIILKPLIFSVIYLGFVRLVASKQFFIYQTLVVKSAEKIKNWRKSE